MQDAMKIVAYKKSNFKQRRPFSENIKCDYHSGYKGVFDTNSDFQMPISMQPSVVDFIFQTMNSVRSKNLNLKYQRLRPSKFDSIPFIAETISYIIL